MSTYDSSVKALQHLNGAILNGRPIKVAIARTEPTHSSQTGISQHQQPKKQSQPFLDNPPYPISGGQNTLERGTRTSLSNSQRAVDGRGPILNRNRNRNRGRGRGRSNFAAQRFGAYPPTHAFMQPGFPFVMNPRAQAFPRFSYSYPPYYPYYPPPFFPRGRGRGRGRSRAFRDRQPTQPSKQNTTEQSVPKSEKATQITGTSPTRVRRPIDPHASVSQTVVIVTQLPYSLTNAQFAKLFEGYNVSSCSVQPPSLFGAKNGGWGLVELTSHEEQQRLLNDKPQLELSGRHCTLKAAVLHTPAETAAQAKEENAPGTK